MAPISSIDVVAAYRLILGRLPESDSVVQEHAGAYESVEELRVKMLESPEFRENLKKFNVGAVDNRVPLDAPRMNIEVETSPERLAAMIRLVEENWQILGEREPHWSVLTNEKFRSHVIGNNLDEFYSTGKIACGYFTKALDRAGLTLDGKSRCFELGCGVGRMTVWLAQMFPEVVAADISKSHLSIAATTLRTKSINNVSLTHLNQFAQIAHLPDFDCFISIIVLQHNPPPLIAVLIRSILKKLASGGIAYFQVPTYYKHGSFKVNTFLRDASSEGLMEVHAVPQSLIWDIARDEDCDIRDVREDDWTGSSDYISNSILLTKRKQMPSMDKKMIEKRLRIPEPLQSARWFHSIEFPDGSVISGTKTLEVMRQEYQQTFGPLQMSAKSVIDFGAWSGAFTVEACRRGATKAVGVDFTTWRDPTCLGREAFHFVTKTFGYDVAGIEQDLDEAPLSLEHFGQFDISLFLGVFYHLRDPIAALREIRKLTREVLVVETFIATELPPEPPAMKFYPNTELCGDASNWWGPNVACVRDLLGMAGFRDVQVSDGTAFNRKVFHAYC